MGGVAVAGAQNEAAAHALKGGLADIGRNEGERFAAVAGKADPAGDPEEAVGVALAPACLDAWNSHIHGVLAVLASYG